MDMGIFMALENLLTSLDFIRSFSSLLQPTGIFPSSHVLQNLAYHEAQQKTV